MLQRRFERVGVYRPTPSSVARLGAHAKEALMLNDLCDLSRLSAALETCAKFDVSSMEDFDRRMATLERRGHRGSEGYRRLESARMYMEANSLMPQRVRREEAPASAQAQRRRRRQDELQQARKAEAQREQQRRGGYRR